MTIHPADSAIYRDLLGDPEVQRLFTDTAEVRAMMLVEGALAKVQGEAGLIPETSARAIHRASMELMIDPAALATETGRSGVPVPALVAAFRKEMAAPEHGAFLHWGATSQDIVDTALSLRLRQALAIVESRLGALLSALASQAAEHAALPMAARTWGQRAVPTSFGAVVAGWGEGPLRALDTLPGLRDHALAVSLSGAAGTLSAMGPDGPSIRAALAKALDLADPGTSWHAARSRRAEVAAWCTGLAGALGKMGRDVALLARDGLVTLGSAGGSSTMPQKQNPVGPMLLEALAAEVTALNTAMQGALVHAEQRDGAAWMAEWLTFPRIVASTAKAVAVATDLGSGLTPRAGRMDETLTDDGGLILAEALTFALAERMPRPEAAAEVKALCARVMAGDGSLPDLARAAYGDEVAARLGGDGALGTASADAQGFAQRVRSRLK